MRKEKVSLKLIFLFSRCFFILNFSKNFFKYFPVILFLSIVNFQDFFIWNLQFCFFLIDVLYPIAFFSMIFAFFNRLWCCLLRFWQHFEIEHFEKESSFNFSSMYIFLSSVLVQNIFFKEEVRFTSSIHDFAPFSRYLLLKFNLNSVIPRERYNFFYWTLFALLKYSTGKTEMYLKIHFTAEMEIFKASL